MVKEVRPTLRRYAMYQTAAAIRASIARHNRINTRNRCSASREVIAFHSSMLGSPTGVFAGGLYQEFEKLPAPLAPFLFVEMPT